MPRPVGKTAPLRGDCDSLPPISTFISFPFPSERQPRFEGIATDHDLDIVNPKFPGRKDSPASRGLRPGIPTPTFPDTTCRKDSPASRGLRLLRTKHVCDRGVRVGKTAPLRGDCDYSRLLRNCQGSLPSERQPRFEGIATTQLQGGIARLTQS